MLKEKPLGLKNEIYTIYSSSYLELSGTKNTVAKNAEEKENGINHNHIFHKRF